MTSFWNRLKAASRNSKRFPHHPAPEDIRWVDFEALESVQRHLERMAEGGPVSGSMLRSLAADIRRAIG